MKTKLTSLLGAISSAAVVIAALWFAGCSTTSSPSTATDAGKPAATAAQPATTAQSAQAAQGGAELWGRNCGHCHNIRSPSSFSDAQWEVVMMHMRVRANLTAEEHKKILAFLKSAH